MMARVGFFKVLGVTGNALVKRSDGWYTHQSIGQTVEILAQRVERIEYHAPQAEEDRAVGYDFPLKSPNIVVRPWAVQRNSLHALRRPWRLIHDYYRLVKSCDALFIRGSNPLIWTIHWMAMFAGKPLVHWVVGNPLAILRAQSRGYGSFVHRLGIVYAWLEQKLLALSQRVCRGVILANGDELANAFRHPRTISVVSSSIRNHDFYVRDDTCQGASIRLLFIGFVRPEKGIEYLIRALPLLQSPIPVNLAIVGSWDQFPHEHVRLCKIVAELGVTDRVQWEGYAAHGPELFSQIDRSDILILPSLSEGTPHVLGEARARSVPIVATRVGGIPSGINDDQDGLLVPPRDSDALAHAISRIIKEQDLRMRLIVEGRRRVQSLTVDCFVDKVMRALTS